MIPAHPLCWPDIIPRSVRRERGRFDTTLSKALDNVERSLRLFGTDSGKPVKDIALSSNVTLGATRPADPGVSAWFSWEGEQICIPVDRYESVEANLQAIHYIIEARRVELRHGTLALVRASFRGFRALPDPNKRDWRAVLGVTNSASLAAVQTKYRALASQNHPDRGGSAERMSEINRAWDQAQQALGTN